MSYGKYPSLLSYRRRSLHTFAYKFDADPKTELADGEAYAYQGNKFQVDDKVRIKGTRKAGFVLRVGESAGGDTWYYCYINGQTIAVVGSDLERI